jgi:hypothetical protein
MEKNYFLLICLMVIRRKWNTPQKKVKIFSREEGKEKQHRKDVVSYTGFNEF